MTLAERRRDRALRTLDRAARDASRPARWATRTGSFVARTSLDRTDAARLFGRLWWLERRHRRDNPLALLRLRPDGDVVELWVSEFNDLHVIRESFGDRVYALPQHVRPRTILDLGAHIGASALWFHRRFPDAEIHAVEPDLRSLGKLRRNVESLPGVTVEHAAVAGEDGERTFYEAKRGWASSLFAAAAPGGEPRMVSALSLPTLVHEHGRADRVDMVKLDVEGAEWELLPRLRLRELTDVVAGELHAGLLGDEPVERDAWRHGLEGFDVHFAGREGSGHFLAVRH
jgi:FkbM family methyltransferase